MKKYSAVIFDLDGTIVDDERFWHTAFQNTAKNKGIEKQIKPVAGRGLKDSWKINGESERAEELAIETRLEFLELVENEANIEPREGFFNLVEYLKEKGYLIGLCTSSHWEVFDSLSEKMNLSGIFDAITTGEEVLLLKPDPEIYRLTCQKLGVEPEECLVFEDSEAGIDSAKACGCEVIKVGDEFDFSNPGVLNTLGQGLESFQQTT